MRNSKLLIFIFITILFGCSDNKDQKNTEVEPAKGWDQQETKWDNSKWD